VQWIAVPTAVLGTIDAERFLRRFLGSWLVVMAVAIPVGWITGWFPPDRIVTFGFAVPIGAALGLNWVLRRHTAHRWITRTAVVLLGGWMILGALLAWGRQAPFVSPAEARLTEAAALYAGTNTPPGTAIVFLVDDDDATATFLGARAVNIARAAASPGRADDVHVVVASATDYFEGRPTERGDPQYDALSRLTLADVPEGLQVVFVLAPFYDGDDASTHPQLVELEPGLLSSRAFPIPGIIAGPDRLSWGPSSPAGIAVATIAILSLVTILGFGYAFASFHDRVTAIATAPAFGTAALTIVAVLLDLLGLRLADVPVAFGASALAGLGGLALFLLVRQRERDRDAAAEISRQPHE
jgi:hypothetical protein